MMYRVTYQVSDYILFFDFYLGVLLLCFHAKPILLDLQLSKHNYVDVRTTKSKSTKCSF